MNNNVKIFSSTTDFYAYFNTNSISEDTRNKFETTDFLVVPSEYKENEYYFAQESISFVKFCRQNNPKKVLIYLRIQIFKYDLYILLIFGCLLFGLLETSYCPLQ